MSTHGDGAQARDTGTPDAALWDNVALNALCGAHRELWEHVLVSIASALEGDDDREDIMLGATMAAAGQAAELVAGEFGGA